MRPPLREPFRSLCEGGRGMICQPQHSQPFRPIYPTNVRAFLCGPLRFNTVEGLSALCV